MITAFQTYLQFSFVRYALIVGALIALCSSLMGVTLVLMRFSFIGDGLSHVAFGAMALAGVLHLSNISSRTKRLSVRSHRRIQRDGPFAPAAWEKDVIAVDTVKEGFIMMIIHAFINSWFI